MHPHTQWVILWTTRFFWRSLQHFKRSEYILWSECMIITFLICITCGMCVPFQYKLHSHNKTWLTNSQIEQSQMHRGKRKFHFIRNITTFPKHLLNTQLTVTWFLVTYLVQHIIYPFKNWRRLSRLIPFHIVDFSNWNYHWHHLNGIVYKPQAFSAEWILSLDES